MPHKQAAYLHKLIEAIENYQDEELYSDRELSLIAGLSPTMVSKIKKGTTHPTLSTLRKLKKAGVDVPKPDRTLIENLQRSQ